MVVWLWFVQWGVLVGGFISIVVLEADNSGLLTLFLRFSFA